MLLEQILEEHLYGMAEDDRIRDFHHGGFQMNREEDALPSGFVHFLFKKCGEGSNTHDRRIDNFTSQHGQLFFEHGDFSVLAG